MLDWFVTLNPILQALLATCFTWSLTALGASAVFFIKTINRKLLDGMLGFAAGVMIAASFWSLLAPAIEMGKGMSLPSWLPAAIGFLVGGACLWGIDRLLPHLHPHTIFGRREGIRTHWERGVLLMLAMTLHNIPEGLAIGVAFGAAATGVPSASLAGAVAIALGVGIQNFPEGIAVSGPLHCSGMTRRKSFWFGQLSAIGEPVAGVLGAMAVVFIRPILPYALAFAAGAMMFVVVEELIPESQQEENADVATIGAMVGFVVMMILDVGLG